MRRELHLEQIPLQHTSCFLNAASRCGQSEPSLTNHRNTHSNLTSVCTHKRGFGSTLVCGHSKRNRKKSEKMRGRTVGGGDRGGADPVVSAVLLLLQWIHMTDARIRAHMVESRHSPPREAPSGFRCTSADPCHGRRLSLP